MLLRITIFPIINESSEKTFEEIEDSINDLLTLHHRKKIILWIDEAHRINSKYNESLDNNTPSTKFRLTSLAERALVDIKRNRSDLHSLFFSASTCDHVFHIDLNKNVQTLNEIKFQDEPTLLCEGSADGKYYCTVVKAFFENDVKQGIIPKTIVFKPPEIENGSGDNTSELIRKIRTKKRKKAPLFSIFDSDEKGKKFHRLATELSKSYPHLFKSMNIGCQTLETMLPKDILIKRVKDKFRKEEDYCNELTLLLELSYKNKDALSRINVASQKNTTIQDVERILKRQFNTLNKHRFPKSTIKFKEKECDKLEIGCREHPFTDIIYKFLLPICIGPKGIYAGI